MAPAPGDYGPLVGIEKSLGNCPVADLRNPPGVTPPDPPHDWSGVGTSDRLWEVRRVAMRGSWGGPGRDTVGHSGDLTPGLMAASGVLILPAA